ncbi:MAG: metallophosphoesterase [Waddliaceae bacterium]
MKIFALADLHLSFGISGKEMDVFGKQWEGWTEKISTQWNEHVGKDDLVLIAGDISWAMHPEDAKADFDWIDDLPGTKAIIRGNHDYWFSSAKKAREALPSSIHLVHHDVFHWNGVDIAGTRLWDTPEFSFEKYIHFVENPKAKVSLGERESKEQMEKIYERELHRLCLSLQQLTSDTRLVMTHYPPIGADLKASRASQLFEEYNVQKVIFGHLHSLKKDVQMFGELNGIEYILSSCDYLGFCPKMILDLSE